MNNMYQMPQRPYVSISVTQQRNHDPLQHENQLRPIKHFFENLSKKTRSLVGAAVSVPLQYISSNFKSWQKQSIH